MKKFHTSRLLLARKRQLLQIDKDLDNMLDSWYSEPALRQETKVEKRERGGPENKSQFEVDERGELVQQKEKEFVMPPRIVKPDLKVDKIVLEPPKKPKLAIKEDNLYYEARHEFVPTKEPKNLDWMDGKVLNFDLPLTPETPKWIKNGPILNTISSENAGTGPVSVGEILNVLHEQKAVNPIVLDVAEKCTHLQQIVICEGVTERHVYALGDAIRKLASYSINNRARIDTKNTSQCPIL